MKTKIKGEKSKNIIEFLQENSGKFTDWEQAYQTYKTSGRPECSEALFGWKFKQLHPEMKKERGTKEVKAERTDDFYTQLHELQRQQGEMWDKARDVKMAARINNTWVDGSEVQREHERLMEAASVFNRRIQGMLRSGELETKTIEIEEIKTETEA